jgi:hypothetical protein
MLMILKAGHSLFLLLSLAVVPADESSVAIPEPLAAFEPFVGAWKGMGIPAADRLKGWRESHNWAWRFERGRPVGLSWSLDANKILSAVQIDPDPVHKGRYLLTGKNAEGRQIRYAGSMDAAGRVFTFERADESRVQDGIQERIVIRMQASGARYTVWHETRSSGSSGWKRAIDVNLGRPEDALAAREADQGPKCIVTGGSASMTVSVAGRSLPICCTGCRDEVLADPEKYLRKFSVTGPKAEQTDQPAASESGKR